MARDRGLDEVVEYFTPDDAERAVLRNKSGASQLGFTAMLKFLLWKGRLQDCPTAAPKDHGRGRPIATGGYLSPGVRAGTPGP